MWKCVANYVFSKNLILRSHWYGQTNLLLKENRPILKIAVISVQHNNNIKADINSHNYQ